LILKTSARFEVPVAVTVDIAVLWGIMPCSQAGIYRLLEFLLPQRCRQYVSPKWQNEYSKKDLSSLPSIGEGSLTLWVNDLLTFPPYNRVTFDQIHDMLSRHITTSVQI
jgi:hypothetical protein